MKVVKSKSYEKIREIIDEETGWFYVQDIVSELDENISKNSIINNLNFLRKGGFLERHREWTGNNGHYAKWRKTSAWGSE